MARLTWLALSGPDQQQQQQKPRRRRQQQQQSKQPEQPRALGARPAAALRPREQRDPGAGLPAHGLAAPRRATTRLPKAHPALRARARDARPLQRGRGRRAPARREAGEARRGRGGPGGPGRGLGAARARRPRRSAPFGASEPLPGNARARARGGELHLPAGPASICWRGREGAPGLGGPPALHPEDTLPGGLGAWRGAQREGPPAAPLLLQPGSFCTWEGACKFRGQSPSPSPVLAQGLQILKD